MKEPIDILGRLILSNLICIFIRLWLRPASAQSSKLDPSILSMKLPNNILHKYAIKSNTKHSCKIITKSISKKEIKSPIYLS
jgi:hypothetical protein